MIELEEIRARLKNEAGATLKAVERVGAIETAMNQARGIPQSPAAFVLLTRETAQPNRYAAGALAQNVQSEFGVLLAVRDVSDAKGAVAGATLESVRLATMTALIGWQPASAGDPVEFRRGSLIRIGNGVTWWLDEFGTSHELEA